MSSRLFQERAAFRPAIFNTEKCILRGVDKNWSNDFLKPFPIADLELASNQALGWERYSIMLVLDSRLLRAGPHGTVSISTL